MRPPEGNVAAAAGAAIAGALPGLELRAELRETRFGTPQPALRLHFPRGTHHRRVSAAMHLVAGLVEAATPSAEAWGVYADRGGGEQTGWVWLELVEGTPAEAERAMAVLREVAGRLRWT
jgi:hypothetical protein